MTARWLGVLGVAPVDGWFWGTDDEFLEGPFESYELAVARIQQHCPAGLKLIILNKQNFAVSEQPPSSGCIIVVDTAGRLWTRRGEVPAGDGWQRAH